MVALAKEINDNYITDHEIKLLKTKYKFLVTKQDCSILSLWLLDKKGFQFLISLGPPGELRWASWKIILLASNTI
jgi:hypothetical protein